MRNMIEQKRLGAELLRAGAPQGQQLAIENAALSGTGTTAPSRRYRNAMSSPATVEEREPSALRRMARALRAPLRLALDVALPPLCPACREVVGESAGLCASCWSKLSPIERPFCERLGIPFVYDPGPGILSMQAIADPPAYTRARAAVRYDEVARALVHAFKYGDRLDLAPTMGKWMARAGQGTAGGCRRHRAGSAALAAELGAAL